MPLTFRKLHPLFAAEVSAVDLEHLHDQAILEEIRRGINEFGVLVFRDQQLTDQGQLAFAQRFDGVLHAKTGAAAIGKNRLGVEALTDISNVDENGDVLDSGDRRRQYSLGNRLWHTDASFQDPAGRYSMLSARVLPPVNANTEFADMRAAWDALDGATRARLDGLRVHHSIAYSRQTLGFEFSAEEQDRLKGAIHPLVRTNPMTGRRSLYLASHASRILDWPVPEGRLLLRDLIEHATAPRFIYSHEWRANDMVMWDNRQTMHRATSFEDTKYKRELRRVTTLDIDSKASSLAA